MKLKLIKSIILTIILLLLILLTMFIWIVTTKSGLHFAIHSVIKYWVPELNISYISGSWSDLNLEHIRYNSNNGITIQIDKLNCSIQIQPKHLNHFNLSIYINNISNININCTRPRHSHSIATRFLSTEKKSNNLKLLTKSLISQSKYKFLMPFSIYLHQVNINNINLKIDNNQIISITNLITSVNYNYQKKIVFIKKTIINGLIFNWSNNLLNLIEVNKIKNNRIKFLTEKINNKELLKTLHSFSVGSKVLMIGSKAIESMMIIPSLFVNLPYNKIRLPINLQLDKIKCLNLHLKFNQQLFLINNLKLSMIAIYNNHITIKKFIITTPESIININIDTNLAKQWSINISAQVELSSNSEVIVKEKKFIFNIVGTLLQHIKLTFIFMEPEQTNTDLEAELSYSKLGVPVTLIIKSKNFYFPLFLHNKYKSQSILRDLRLSFHGTTKSYNCSLRTAIVDRNQQIPPISLLLNATGNEKQLILTSLKLDTLHGKIQLNGIIKYSNQISWNGTLTFSDINNEKPWPWPWPKWPFRLNGQIITTSRLLSDGRWIFNIPKIILDGHIRGYLLTIRGKIIENIYGKLKGQMPILKLLVGIGSNRLLLNSYININDIWQLDAIIDAPSIHEIKSNLKGIVKGKFSLLGIGPGPLPSPKLIANIKVNNVEWQDNFTISKIRFNSFIHSNQNIQSKIFLTIYNLKKDNFVINNLTMLAIGSEDRHNLRININGNPISLLLTSKGSFDRKNEKWKLILYKSVFDMPLFGKWKLNNHSVIEYANQQKQIKISPHCWLNEKGSVCLSKTANISKISANYDFIIKKFDLELLNHFLPQKTKLFGQFDGIAKVSLHHDANSSSSRSNNFHLPNIKLDLFSNNFKINQFIKDKESFFSVKFKKIKIIADISHRQAILKLVIKSIDNETILGTIRIDDLERKRKIFGHLNLKITNFSSSLIQSILNSKVTHINGNLNAKINLSGDLKKPLLNGYLIFSNLIAKGQLFPFDIINNSFLKIIFNGYQSKLIGRINTIDGYLNLIGEANWDQKNSNIWKSKILATSERLKISLPPFISMNIKPNIILEANPNLLMLNGNVDISSARIRFKERLNSTLDVSSDEIMLDANLHPIENKMISLPIVTKLQIKIGNDVSLDAFGLKAKLTGKLTAIQDKQGLLLNGQINLPEGRFYAYGQNLIVRKGQIIFNGPVDYPFLNIEAIRNPDNNLNKVIAGIRITGLANKPKTIIFSEPQVQSQEEALSYLISGEGLNSIGVNSVEMTSLIISAGLGLAKSGKLIGNIGEILGVSNLSLDTHSFGNQSKFVLSGNITNDLQVKYSLGLFDSLATLTLRYRLMPRLYLEAVSGVNQALDILYQFEF